MRTVLGRPRAVGPLWHATATAIALAVLAPLAALAWTALGAGTAHWGHLVAHVLPLAAAQTATLLAGVGLLTALVGTGSAWLVTRTDFPGRAVLQWALLLPLTVPTYIAAYSYVDLLHPIGPFQSAVRALLGVESPRQFRLPDARSMTGAVLVLSAVLYPYVYLSMRAMFATQPARLMEVARLLGEGPWGAFRRVALPMARPALAVGVGLVLLEVLNDVGASEFLGVTTLTTTVYTTWITRSDLGAAAQIACAMLAMVALLVWLERQGRRRRRAGDAMRGRGDGRRVDATREQHAHGHVAAQPDAHRVGEELAQRLDELRQRLRARIHGTRRRVVAHRPARLRRRVEVELEVAAGLEPLRLSICNSVTVIARLVAEGVAIGLLPAKLIEADAAAGRIQPLQVRPAVEHVRLHAAYRAGEGGRAARAVITTARMILGTLDFLKTS